MNINRNNYHYGVWSTRTINDILKNEIYIGNLIQCKQKKVNYKSKKRIRNTKDNYIICKNIVDPIIDINTFNIVQNMFKTNKYKKETSNLLLKGFRYQKQKLKTKEVIRIYGNCNYWSKRKSEHVCTPHSIKYNIIEECILKEIKQLINTYLNKNILINIITKYNNKNNVDKINKELINIQKNIENINKKIDATYLDKLEGIITQDMYLRIYTNLTQEQINYQKNYQILLKQLNKNNNTNYIDKIQEFLNNPNQLLITNLIDKIEINENKEIYIYYKFKLN